MRLHDLWLPLPPVTSSLPDHLRTYARELLDARQRGELIATPFSARDTAFDLSAAYAVEAELARVRRASGHDSVGYKVGFANKALWRVLGLETVVWAHMYDDTVRVTTANSASIDVAAMWSPKIEPEIVFTMKAPIDGSGVDAAGTLGAVDSIALGFEIIDCPFPNWTFQPSDFVAAFGFHAALIVGERRAVREEDIAELVEQLAKFKVRLFKNDTVVAEGSGRNVLRSPVLCLGELVAAMARRPSARPLASGDLISSGTLTDSQPILSGQTWRAEVDGLALSPLTLRT